MPQQPLPGILVFREPLPPVFGSGERPGVFFDQRPGDQEYTEYAHEDVELLARRQAEKFDTILAKEIHNDPEESVTEDEYAQQ